MNLKGSYINLGETPTERLRNKLNPILHIIDMLQSGDTDTEDVKFMITQAKRVDIDEIVTYIEDCETLIYDDVKKPWEDLIKK